jgi:hypothetical protein
MEEIFLDEFFTNGLILVKKVVHQFQRKIKWKTVVLIFGLVEIESSQFFQKFLLEDFHFRQVYLRHHCS